jgi:hypothetical protein
LNPVVFLQRNFLLLSHLLKFLLLNFPLFYFFLGKILPIKFFFVNSFLTPFIFEVWVLHFLQIWLAFL